MKTFKIGDMVLFEGKLGQLISSVDKNDGTFMFEYIDEVNREYEPMSTCELIRSYKDSVDEIIPNRRRDHWVFGGELKSAKIKNTKLARKLYPKYKEDGEWLIIK